MHSEIVGIHYFINVYQLFQIVKFHYLHSEIVGIHYFGVHIHYFGSDPLSMRHFNWLIFEAAFENSFYIL